MNGILAFGYKHGHVTLIDVSPIFALDNPTSETLPLNFQLLSLTNYTLKDSHIKTKLNFVKKHMEINGVEWSYDGAYLYVATDTGVWVYHTVGRVKRLEDVCYESLYGKLQGGGELDEGIIEKVREWGCGFNWFPHWLL